MAQKHLLQCQQVSEQESRFRKSITDKNDNYPIFIWSEVWAVRWQKGNENHSVLKKKKQKKPTEYGHPFKILSLVDTRCHD